MMMMMLNNVWRRVSDVDECLEEDKSDDGDKYMEEAK